MGGLVIHLLLLTYLTAIAGEVIITQPKSKNLTVSSGSDLDLDCRHPLNDTVIWRISGTPIKNTTYDLRRFIISETRAKDGHYVISHLTVNDIKSNPNEGGHYTCSNSDIYLSYLDPTQSDYVNIKVINSDAVVEIEGPAGRTISEGADLLLICTGELSSELTWLYEGHPIETSTQVIITPEVNYELGRKRLAFTRHDVRPEHSGQYNCYDQNNRVRKSIRIDVIESIRTTDFAIGRGSSILLTITTLLTAYFFQSPQG